MVGRRGRGDGVFRGGFDLFRAAAVSTSVASGWFQDVAVFRHHENGDEIDNGEGEELGLF